MNFPVERILFEHTVTGQPAPPSFLVVMPTIRHEEPLVRDVVARSAEKLTRRTRFVVLDGSAGKAQTLNACLDWLAVMKPTQRPEVFVTQDDDFIPPTGWQDVVAEAVLRVAKLGIASFDLTGLGERGTSYMLGTPTEQSIAGFACKAPPVDRMPGCFFAMKTATAMEMGKTPILTGTKYQVWEDVWRCRRAAKLGLVNVYLVGKTDPEILPVPEAEPYASMKAADITAFNLVAPQWMRQNAP